MSSARSASATVKGPEKGTGAPAKEPRPSRSALEDEPELVQSVQAGDGEAFAVLVDRYMDSAYAVALSILRGEPEAEDAVQSAFIRALERIGQLRKGSPFGPWFYRVLRSTCLNLRRRETLRAHGEIPASASGGPDPERETERRRIRAHVLEALDRLPEMQRMAVLLYDIEGYDHAEIGRILGIASGTSRANLHHGRRALRELLREEFGEEFERDDPADG